MSDHHGPRLRVAAEWVLFRAEERGLPAWWRRSALVHTLAIGGGFAVLLLATAGRVLDAEVPGAGPHLKALLAAAAALALVPLPLAALRHARARVLAVEVDPAGLTLHTPRGPVDVRLARLAEVRAVAEPVFGSRSARARGRLSELPSFVAALRLRTTEGAVWEFASAQPGEVEGVLAWLDVLEAGDKVRRFPSALAAKRSASDGLRHAEGLLGLAIAGCAASLALQLLDRVDPGLVPNALAWSLAAVAAGCALYLASFRAQVRAARAWLESRGLGGAPPLADDPGLAAAPSAVAPR